MLDKPKVAFFIAVISLLFDAAFAAPLTHSSWPDHTARESAQETHHVIFPSSHHAQHSPRSIPPSSHDINRGMSHQAAPSFSHHGPPSHSHYGKPYSVQNDFINQHHAHSNSPTVHYPEYIPSHQSDSSSQHFKHNICHHTVPSLPHSSDTSIDPSSTKRYSANFLSTSSPTTPLSSTSSAPYGTTSSSTSLSNSTAVQPADVKNAIVVPDNCLSGEKLINGSCREVF